MPPALGKKPLPSKENTLFKELLSLYETRQLKKGLKIADQILKKFPDHGETLCMKGLVLTHMGRREEGLELVKKGIRLDLTSHICWHVFGLIQKGEKNYEEALKSYTQALRFDRENLNLLQDAANLQTHLRQYDSLQDTREFILKLRPNNRRNWIFLAVACHLNGDLSRAKSTLEQYERILKNVPDYDFEHSEVLLYHVRILEELDETQEALSLLDANAKSRVIVDRTAVLEIRARLLSKLDNKDEAEQAWQSLIAKNSDCLSYYRGYFKYKGIDLESLSDEQRDDALHLLQELIAHHPRANTPRRLALDVALGQEFHERATKYLHNGITKGIPSLYADIKSLYSDSTKQRTIEDIVTEFKIKYEPSPEQINGDVKSEPPTTYLWTLYFLAQHYSHPSLRHYSLAITLLDTAIAHTPTLPELHTLRARILKRMGDPIGAISSIEEARTLDGQDRFLNTKSAKYHLRAGLSEEASSILGLFVKKDAPSPGADLEEMQSLLYLTEEADCQRRLGKLGLALKKYLAIKKVFDDFYDDQYDFHSYSIRRFTINTYTNLVSWEDHLYEHSIYIKAALEASRIYCVVHDDPKKASSHAANGKTDAEKKAQKKAKKAALKQQEEAKKGTAANANISHSNEDRGLEPPPTKDEDLDGHKALAAPGGLDQAWKLLRPLTLSNLKRVDVWLAVYDISVRQRRYLQASKALLKAQSLDREDPEVHVRIVDFKQRISSLPDPLSPVVGPLVNSTLSKLLPEEVILETYNSQFLQRHSSSPSAILAAAEVLHKLKAPMEEVDATIFSAFGPDVKLDVKNAFELLRFLSRIGSAKEAEFRMQCGSRFEGSTVFKTPEEQAKLFGKLKEQALTSSTNGSADASEEMKT